MAKSRIALLVSAALSVAPAVMAGKNSPNPLADITPGGCTFEQIAPYGTSLLAKWSWENGTTQTKFGGDAEFDVSASADGGVTWQELEVELELERYEPGTPADDYAGTLVYRCSVAETEPAGDCNGSVLGLRAAILNAAADALGVDPDLIGGNISAALDGVKVKAMNPGSRGRQNYERVNICEQPI